MTEFAQHRAALESFIGHPYYCRIRRRGGG